MIILRIINQDLGDQDIRQGFYNGCCPESFLKFLHVDLSIRVPASWSEVIFLVLFLTSRRESTLYSPCSSSLALGGLGLRKIPVNIGISMHVNVRSCWACIMPSSIGMQQQNHQGYKMASRNKESAVRISLRSKKLKIRSPVCL